jgi:hypothetical protein
LSDHIARDAAVQWHGPGSVLSRPESFTYHSRPANESEYGLVIAARAEGSKLSSISGEVIIVKT